MPQDSTRSRRLVRTAPLSLALAATTALAAPVQAQDAANTVTTADAAPVVVTATRIPTELDKTGASVTVITEEDIEAAQDRQVTDTLRRVPGVDIVQNGGFGSQASVFLRGTSSEQTLVLIDGVKMNDPTAPSGGFNFGGLTASDIERIEILRGPQSTLYGSEAIGGVISITTKSGQAGFSGNAFVEGGSYRTLRASSTLRGGDDKASGSINITGARSDGISSADENNGNDEEDGFGDVTLTAKGSVRPVDSLEFGANLRFSDRLQEIDNTPGPGNLQTDAIFESHVQKISGKISATHFSFSDRLENKISASVFETERKSESSFGPFRANGDRVSLNYDGIADVTDWSTLSFGAQYEDTSYDGIASFETVSGYGLVQITPIDRLTLSGGLRHDSNSDAPDATTGRATVAFDIYETGTTLRGVWGEGFKQPTLNQLFGPFGANPNLQPEKSESFEIGVDQTILPGRLEAGVTLFYQEVDDLIDYQSGTGYVNVDEARQKGVEATLSATVTDWARVNANYTYLDAIDETTDDRLDGRAKHKGSLELRVTPTEDLMLSSNVAYNGKVEDTPFGTNGVMLDDYVLVSLRASYDIDENWTAFGRVENALDTEYQRAFGYGTPDASGYAGVRVSF